MSGELPCGRPAASLSFPHSGGDGHEPDPDQLKFVALDEEDLEVVSTHLQDAAVKVADVLWRPNESRVVVAFNRFDWKAPNPDRPEHRCCRSALRFERVLILQCRSVDPAGKDAVLNLLTVEFTETDSPSGGVDLIFSAARRCGSRSNAWRPNWLISALVSTAMKCRSMPRSTRLTRFSGR